MELGSLDSGVDGEYTGTEFVEGSKIFFDAGCFYFWMVLFDRVYCTPSLAVESDLIDCLLGVSKWPFKTNDIPYSAGKTRLLK